MMLIIDLYIMLLKIISIEIILASMSTHH